MSPVQKGQNRKNDREDDTQLRRNQVNFRGDIPKTQANPSLFSHRFMRRTLFAVDSLLGIQKTPLPVDTGKRGAGDIRRTSHLPVYHTDGIGT